MSDLLARTADLPEIDLDLGQQLVTEGGVAGPIWILVSGSLRVHKAGVLVGMISRPGSVVGEISVLLGADHGATVEAAEASRVRVAGDGRAFLGGDVEVLRAVAVGMAERLDLATTYLADLKHQYGDAPGLSMVSEVLATLANHQQPQARPGSTRDPDPEY